MYGRLPQVPGDSGRRGKGNCVMEPVLPSEGVQEGFAASWADLPSTEKGEKATPHPVRGQQTRCHGVIGQERLVLRARKTRFGMRCGGGCWRNVRCVRDGVNAQPEAKPGRGCEVCLVNG